MAEQKPIQLQKIIHASIELLELQAKQKNICIKTESSTEFENLYKVFGDEGKLWRIMLNLLGT